MNKTVSTKLKKFFKNYPDVKTIKGTIILSSGDSGKNVFFLESGLVRSYSINKNGEETTLLLFKPFSFFPSIPLFLGKTNSYYFQTIIPSTLYKAPKEEVFEFIKTNPDILLDLTTRILKGIEGLFLQIELMGNGSAYQKLVNLLRVSTIRFGTTNNHKISLPFTHQLIGSITGSKRETISRQLKKLREKNIIDITPGKIIIENSSLLESEMKSFS
ncbi:Crp/Fnr family transcriptional regulator [Candidatus Gottesmanbacteria bacterium]|nr:Crp/Fnr family transcriptional regulator [Candidatus Gottesmanbacteria bacterium]